MLTIKKAVNPAEDTADTIVSNIVLDENIPKEAPSLRTATKDMKPFMKLILP